MLVIQKELFTTGTVVDGDGKVTRLTGRPAYRYVFSDDTAEIVFKDDVKRIEELDSLDKL